MGGEASLVSRFIENLLHLFYDSRHVLQKLERIVVQPFLLATKHLQMAIHLRHKSARLSLIFSIEGHAESLVKRVEWLTCVAHQGHAFRHSPRIRPMILRPSTDTSTVPMVPSTLATSLRLSLGITEMRLTTGPSPTQ